MSSALNADLYELTMAAGYVAARKTDEIATFELMIRRLPKHRNFLVAAGLAQAIDYLRSLRFAPEEIDYLRSLEQFQNAPPQFFEVLAGLRFTGDLFAMPEGTPVFPGEPLAIVRAPIVEAQIVETYLLATLGFQSSVASKAARCVQAAEGRPILEFGSRRAHSPAAAVLAARAAYIGGCAGTSNTLAGMRFGVPVSGTSAHSWTMSFESEQESFRELQQLLGDGTVFLVDTYDPVEGTRRAALLGHPAWGVRLDSGDLKVLSRRVRKLLDECDLTDTKIFATNDLDEHRIADLVRDGAPIDAFGVGTQLSTSADAPALGAVYKLVELRQEGRTRYTAKYSPEKGTLPGAKQIYRRKNCDWMCLSTECSTDGEPLLRPVLIGGELLEPLPSLLESQQHARRSIAALPSQLLSIEAFAPYVVEPSVRLAALAEEIRLQYSQR
jgi:nicotinate phosphoribosyltransferase